MDEALNHRPARRHPVVEALAEAASRNALTDAPLKAAIDARFDAVDFSPFGEESALRVYLKATEGGIVRAALDILAPGRSDDDIVEPAAIAWGLAQLARERPSRLPRSLAATPLRAAVAAALSDARAAASRLPTRAFPAVAHLTLARAYASGRASTELGKRFRLVRAVAAGRV